MVAVRSPLHMVGLPRGHAVLVLISCGLPDPLLVFCPVGAHLGRVGGGWESVTHDTSQLQFDQIRVHSSRRGVNGDEVAHGRDSLSLSTVAARSSRL